MRRLSLPLVILVSIIVAAFLTSMALAQGTDRKDEPQTETTPLAAFKRIEVSGSATIVLIQDTNGPLVATVPQNAATKVSVRVQKETLYIKAADGGRWWSNLFGRGPAGTVQLTIHFKDLESIEASGVVRISAREIRVPALSIDGSGGTTIQIDDLRATSLSVEGSGALKAELAGQVTGQSVSVSGAADYQAAKLVSDNASVEVSGAGKIVVNARKKLNASISGAGVVEYVGDPAVTQSISGAGRVRRRETADADGPRIALRD
jgi:Putative auto-transporter adhesin, head GIN domain